MNQPVEIKLRATCPGCQGQREVWVRTWDQGGADLMFDCQTCCVTWAEGDSDKWYQGTLERHLA